MAIKSSSWLSQAKEVWGDVKENETVRKFSHFLPQWNFITFHYTYFIFTILLTSLIFWGTSNPSKSITYTDSLFLVTSAMTEAGLNTVNLSQMTTFQQVLLWFLIVMGSSIFVSIATVHARKRVFEQRFEDIVKAQRALRKSRRSSRSASRSRGPFMRRAVTYSAGDTPVDGPELGFGKHHEPIDRHEFESRHSGPRDPTPRDLETKSLNLSPRDLDREAPTPAQELRNHDETTNIQKGTSTESTSSGPSVAIAEHEKIGIAPEDIVDEGVQIRGRQISKENEHIQYAPSPTRLSARGRILTTRAPNKSTTTSAYRSPRPIGLTHRNTKTSNSSDQIVDGEKSHVHYPTYLTKYTTGRNAQFHGLTREEREHLGGVEYRAICLLAWVVPVYFVLWQVLGCVGLGWYFSEHKRDVIAMNGINAWWLGVFNAVSAFNNSGMSLLDANMIPFQTSVYTLMTMGLLILAGNTALLKLLTLTHPSPTSHASLKSTLRFTLRYPRRIYTNLFPSAPTWWLLFMVVVLNGVDWAAFELLNIGNEATSNIPEGYRILDGLFQALAVRSGGFYVIGITSLRIGLQVLYVIMMYISVYPVVITMRHSNVYEERSLGIYADSDSEDEDEESAVGRSSSAVQETPKLGALAGRLKRTLTITLDNLSTPFSSQTMAPRRLGGALQNSTTTGKQFVRQQIRGQLAHDIWWLVLAILLISCIEVSNFDRDPVTYSVFNIAFEVVSGYGCVGISTGLKDQAYSFSGGWRVASKLVLCAVMLRGRHRGLPVALDRAVRLPEGIERGLEAEEEEGRLKRTRTWSVRGAGRRGSGGASI